MPTSSRLATAHALSCGRTAVPLVQAAFTAANAAFEQARPASAAATLAIGRAAPPIRADSAAAPSGMEVAESELASAGATGSAEAELRGTKRSHGEAAAGSPPASASAGGGAAALPRAAALSQLVVTEEDATVDEALFPTGKLDVEGQQAWLGPLLVRFRATRPCPVLNGLRLERACGHPATPYPAPHGIPGSTWSACGHVRLPLRAG
jgi:hypothetical protein